MLKAKRNTSNIARTYVPHRAKCSIRSFPLVRRNLRCNRCCPHLVAPRRNGNKKRICHASKRVRCAM